MKTNFLFPGELRKWAVDVFSRLSLLAVEELLHSRQLLEILQKLDHILGISHILGGQRFHLVQILIRQEVNIGQLLAQDKRSLSEESIKHSQLFVQCGQVLRLLGLELRVVAQPPELSPAPDC